MRPARDDELDRVGDLTVRAYVEGTSLDQASDYVHQLRRSRDRAAASPLLVAVIDDEVVGAISLCPYASEWAEVARPGELELRMLAIDPARRGRGIADQLIEAAAAFALTRADQALVISVIEDNTPAHRLYARHSFVRRPDRDWDPTPEAHLLVYTRDI